MIARMMLSGANVLVLEQPKNHLDLESITALIMVFVTIRAMYYLLLMTMNLYKP